MERILFIVPPHLRYEDFMRPKQDVRTVVKSGGDFGNVATDMPLGPMSLSSYLKAHAEVDVRLADFNVLLAKRDSFPYASFAEYFMDALSAPEWMEFDPTIIGISALFNPSYKSILDFANIGKELFPSALMIGGGGIPTNQYRHIFEDCDTYDALCYGEGENPMLKLVQAPDKRQFLETSPAWVTARKAKNTAMPAQALVTLQPTGKTIALPFKPESDIIEDVDAIPPWDYTLTNVEDYDQNPAVVAYAPTGKKGRIFHIMTSRGCPYFCDFCSSWTVHGRAMRYNSMDRVKRDFTELKHKYGATTFVFQDDHLMGDKKRAMEIFRFTAELGMKGVFQNGLLIEALDREMLEAIRPIADHLVLPVESGSQRVLHDIMHKPLRLATVPRVVRDCRELGIYPTCNILIGNVGKDKKTGKAICETRQDIEDGRNFLKNQALASWYIILIATPLAGTEMYDVCVENNYLQGDPRYSEFKKANVETPEFSRDYIQDAMYDLNLDLNFVCNADMRLGNYAVALKGFLNVIRAKDDHAFAHHYAALCYGQLGQGEQSRHHGDLAAKAAQHPFWQKWLARFPQVEIGRQHVLTA